jgi:hypothetical protein
MAAIHSQREDDAPVVVLVSTLKIVFHFASENPTMQPITLTVQGTG